MMSSSSTVPFASDDVTDRLIANVDVWQVIFEMLSVKDRIRLEMTNKRLGILMLEYWKRVTSFDTERFTDMNYDSSTSCDRENLSEALVAICVNRVGDCLRSLTIRGKFFPTTGWSANLRSIGKGCPNVETMNCVLEHKNVTLNIGLDSFSRLKTLTVSTERGDYVNASASLFLSIPTSIEVIRGLNGEREPFQEAARLEEDCQYFENAVQMEGFFIRRPSLRAIYLGHLQTRDRSKADIFRVIAERCPHLKSIKLPRNYYNCIDYHGVIALESMKELRFPHVYFDEMEIVTICERSPLVEALELELRFSSNIHRRSAALNALGSLTKLSDLRLSIESADMVAPSLITEFVLKLARNSGASLRRLAILTNYPHRGISLPTAAIDALANGCAKLRDVEFYVRVGEATPTSIRFLIDSIVAHPSWSHETGEGTLVINIYVVGDNRDEYIAGRAAFEALAAPAANLPAGVRLIIR